MPQLGSPAPTGAQTPFGVADAQGLFPHVSSEIGARPGAWDGVPNGIGTQVDHVASGIGARRATEALADIEDERLRAARARRHREGDTVPRVRDEGAACDTDADCRALTMGSCGDDPIAMNLAFAARVEELLARRNVQGSCPTTPTTHATACLQGYCVLPGAPDLDNRRPRRPQPDGQGFWFETPTHRNGLRAWGGEKTEVDFPPQPDPDANP